MSSLTKLTLKAALDGLAAREFTSVELTQAHIEAVEAARGLNAYILETPDKALDMAAKSDARRALGEAGPLEGAPLGVKDLFVPRACGPRPARRSSRPSCRPTSRPSPASCGATAR